MMAIDFDDPQWRFAERVRRLTDKGYTREESEEMVRTVIMTKEIEPAEVSEGEACTVTLR